jgi:hypothetical protein
MANIEEHKLSFNKQNHITPTYCTFSFTIQWQKNAGVNTTYFVYRWAFAILFLSVWIWSFISAAQQNTPTENFLSKWPIYLTNWGYTLCTAQALLAVGLIAQQLIKEKTTGAYSPVWGPATKHTSSIQLTSILDPKFLTDL